MPSNRDLIASILELNQGAETEGLSNVQLAAMLAQLKASPAELAEAPEPVVEAPKGPCVATGKTITTMRGILSKGDPIAATDLSGGQDAFDKLTEAGYITKG